MYEVFGSLLLCVTPRGLRCAVQAWDGVMVNPVSSSSGQQIVAVEVIIGKETLCYCRQHDLV